MIDDKPESAIAELPKPRSEKPKRARHRRRRVIRTPNTHKLDKRADELAEAGVGDPDDLLSTRELASWFNVSVGWVQLARMGGYGPASIRFNARSIKYRRAAVIQWLEDRAITKKQKAPAA